MGTLDDVLAKGIKAARENRELEARALLSEVVRADPSNETGWLWLSAVVSTDQERARCLERALEINPVNTYAKSGLEYVRRRLGPRHLPPATYSAHDAGPISAWYDQRDSKAPELACPNCGGNIDVDSRFCGSCGQALRSHDPDDAEAAGSLSDQSSRGHPWYKGSWFKLAVMVAVLVACVAAGKNLLRTGASVVEEVSTTAPDSVVADVSTTAPDSVVAGSVEGTPDYVKSLVAYKEGSYAFAVYFVLADVSGAMVPGAGTVEITISETKNIWSTYSSKFFELDKVLYTRSIRVTRADFQRAKVGLGGFEHEVLLCSLGRIAFSNFLHLPQEMTGKVRIKFTTSEGRVLDAEETVFF